MLSAGLSTASAFCLFTTTHMVLGEGNIFTSNAPSESSTYQVYIHPCTISGFMFSSPAAVLWVICRNWLRAFHFMVVHSHNQQSGDVIIRLKCALAEQCWGFALTLYSASWLINFSVDTVLTFCSMHLVFRASFRKHVQLQARPRSALKLMFSKS